MWSFTGLQPPLTFTGSEIAGGEREEHEQEGSESMNRMADEVLSGSSGDRTRQVDAEEAKS